MKKPFWKPLLWLRFGFLSALGFGEWLTRGDPFWFWRGIVFGIPAVVLGFAALNRGRRSA
jgi:hypothetical protein